jgi:rare lipoprotein A (peptidoglycan hydrolase)
MLKPRTLTRVRASRALALSAAVLIVVCAGPAGAGGWGTVHRYVHKTGKCTSGSEVLATRYSIGTHTASGERMNAHSLTAASHDYPLGTTIDVTNPHTGKSCSIRINDRGPFGRARSAGVRIDFAPGAANCLGLRGTQYVCMP